MKEPITFKDGCMCEGYPWQIKFDHECSSFSGGDPCKHCHSKKTLEHQNCYGGTYSEKVWICPKVVVAYNEGECNCTEVCLDCILEAVKDNALDKSKIITRVTNRACRSRKEVKYDYS